MAHIKLIDENEHTLKVDCKIKIAIKCSSSVLPKNTTAIIKHINDNINFFVYSNQ